MNSDFIHFPDLIFFNEIRLIWTPKSWIRKLADPYN